MAPTEQQEKVPATKTVEFVGVPPFGREFHGERSVDSAAWKAVGIDASKMTWTADNGWRVQVPADNAVLLEYFSVKENGFKVLTED